MSKPPSIPHLARQRAREEILRQIIEIARQHLATEGASGLSLRAVARDLGIVSSAIYRYVSSRDDLLTMLIVNAYNALGETVEQAESAIPRDNTQGRWIAVCEAVRNWGISNPHEYALIYGSPVPGYAAPPDTVSPATRVTVVLAQILLDVVLTENSGHQRMPDPAVDDSLRAAMAPMRPFLHEAISDDLAMRGLMAWTYLFGAVSCELFGHRHNVIDDNPDLRRVFFLAEVIRIGQLAGIDIGKAAGQLR